MANIKAQVRQVTPVAQGSDGDYGYLSMSKMGDLFTADWKTKLALAGRVYSLDLGTAGTPLTGNHDIDVDQPEFVVAVDSGYLIPLSLNLALTGDADAYNDSMQILVVADRTQAQAAGATATAEVPLNFLDGGPAFSGRAYSVVTGNLTAVTEADILYAKTIAVVQVVAETAGNGTIDYGCDTKFDVPRLIAGPCQIIGYVVGVGDEQTSSFIGNFCFAHIPASWVPAS